METDSKWCLPSVISAVLVGLAVPALMTEAQAAPSREQVKACEALWNDLYERHGGDHSALRVAWRAESAKCAGTGVYEYHLATLAEMAQEFDEAIRILEGAVNAGTPLRSHLYVTKLGMQFNQADYQRPRDEAGMKSAHEKLEAFLRENPDFTPAIHVVASQRVQLLDYKGGEDMARKGVAIEPDNGRSLSALIIALAATDRCAEAKPMIRPTLEKNTSLFTDYEFMMAAAFCYFNTGDVLTAEQVLLRLKSLLPDSANEPGFQRLASAILKEKSKRADK